MAELMTWGGLIGQARFLLQDQRAGEYRYPDDQLLAACHLACLTAKQIRPDIFYGRYIPEGADSACFPPPPYDEDLLEGIKAREAPFPEIYHQPVILFISGYAELVNEEHADTGRAAVLLSSFKNQLTKGG